MSLESDKEVQQWKNRLRELAQRAYQQNIFTFSGFLGLSEQNIFWQLEQELTFIPYELWGGYSSSDRKIVRFGSGQELGYEEPYPISCIHIKPVMVKFSDDFSHRDFLGALMNLGIDRTTLGDIQVGAREGYLFCQNSIAPFVCENLEQVKHTRVICEITKELSEVKQEKPAVVELVLPSERLDVCIAKVYHKSRNEVIHFVQAGKVYVDGRLCENHSRVLKKQETVNVRGFGKFVYSGVLHETKKGKLSVQILLYA